MSFRLLCLECGRNGWRGKSCERVGSFFMICQCFREDVGEWREVGVVGCDEWDVDAGSGWWCFVWLTTYSAARPAN